ncbi:MAG TPA: Rmf/CrpP family protein [Terriglobales bacterium]|nr:Rmf/CrpP family protein [Terriglobales bacterium]
MNTAPNPRAGAFRKGYEAGKAGADTSACPYARKGPHDTYSDVFARAWLNGHAAGAAERDRTRVGVADEGMA